MARNVEIKARVRDWGGLVERVERLAAGAPEVQAQEDTFYRRASGRLKLRVLAPDRGTLICYQRDDAAGPKTSRYLVAPTQDPSSLAEVLAMALGVRGVVRKERLLYWVGQTRVHAVHAHRGRRARLHRTVPGLLPILQRGARWPGHHAGRGPAARQGSRHGAGRLETGQTGVAGGAPPGPFRRLAVTPGTAPGPGGPAGHRGRRAPRR